MSHFVCVCGGRDFDRRVPVYDMLWFLQQIYEDDLRLIHGAARGADRIAASVADELGIVQRAYPAAWEMECMSRCNQNHRKIVRGRSVCPSAGVYRNEFMADLLAKWARQGHSCQVIAYPGGTGTAHMMAYSESVGLVVDRIGQGA